MEKGLDSADGKKDRNAKGIESKRGREILIHFKRAKMTKTIYVLILIPARENQFTGHQNFISTLSWYLPLSYNFAIAYIPFIPFPKFKFEFTRRGSRRDCLSPATKVEFISGKQRLLKSLGRNTARPRDSHISAFRTCRQQQRHHRRISRGDGWGKNQLHRNRISRYFAEYVNFSL